MRKPDLKHFPQEPWIGFFSGVRILCVFDNEEREHGVGAGVNVTMLSERIGIISLVESALRMFIMNRESES